MAELKDLPMLSLKTLRVHLRVWLLMANLVMVESLDLTFHPLQAAVAEIEVAEAASAEEEASEEAIEAASAEEAASEEAIEAASAEEADLEEAIEVASVEEAASVALEDQDQSDFELAKMPLINLCIFLILGYTFYLIYSNGV